MHPLRQTQGITPRAKKRRPKLLHQKQIQPPHHPLPLPQPVVRHWTRFEPAALVGLPSPPQPPNLRPVVLRSIRFVPGALVGLTKPLPPPEVRRWIKSVPVVPVVQHPPNRLPAVRRWTRFGPAVVVPNLPQVDHRWIRFEPRAEVLPSPPQRNRRPRKPRPLTPPKRPACLLQK